MVKKRKNAFYNNSLDRSLSSTTHPKGVGIFQKPITQKFKISQTPEMNGPFVKKYIPWHFFSKLAFLARVLLCALTTPPRKSEKNVMSQLIKRCSFSKLQTVMWIRIDCIRIRIQAGSRSINHQIFKTSFNF